MKGTHAFVVLSVAGGVAAIVLIAHRIGADLAAAALAITPVGHVLALVAFAVHLWMRGLRVALVARGIGARLSVRDSIRAQLAGDAAGAVTPSRIGCDPAKMMVLRRAGVDLGTGAAIMMGEILAEVAVLIVVASFAAFALPSAGPAAAGAFSYALAVVLTTSSALLFARTPRGREAPPIWRRLRLSEESWRRVHGAAAHFLTRARELTRLPPHTFLALAGATLAHIAARLALLPLLLVDQISIGAVPALLAWPLLLLYAGALVPTPGGGGAIELGFAAGLDEVLGPELLIGALVWWRLYGYYLSTLLGGVVLALAGAPRGVERPA